MTSKKATTAVKAPKAPSFASGKIKTVVNGEAVDLKLVPKSKKTTPPVEPLPAPSTPLTKLLTRAGFEFVKSEAQDDQNTAHGYNHPDGSAAMFIHANISSNVSTRWILVRSGKRLEGKTSKELAVALIKPEALPAHLVSALDILRKATKNTYQLATLAGDQNYKLRVQLLKKLKNSDKVLVKDSGVNNVVRAFYDALGVEKASAAAMAVEFETRCLNLAKTDRKAEAAVIRVEKAEVKQATKQAGGAVLIHDDKPVLPGRKILSAKKQAIADEQDKTTLLAQIAAKRKQEEYTPLAVPRPEASISVNLDDVCILEDPNNGITLLCLEKPNSQGAICVYNNGSRVAAGVVPTEVLITLRPLISEDLVRDVNQLLNPLTAGVIVTPVAETHLTAVLAHCKEKIDMATETAVKTKKFAAPVKNAAAAKKTAAKAEKPVKAAKAAKAEKAPSSRVKYTDDTKIKLLHKGENPYREGTKARNSFELIAKSKTFGEYATFTEKSKTDVYAAAYFAKWASTPHGKAPAYIAIG